ncbi:hypothetical protein [Nitrosomonas sp. Nm132]|uniref:beta strand repeat-containing protein n=1 Tax=Nitrosomonas sp. Nm132 TaxID=1881053 RepID=UPI000884C43C|nr:hypothetical protein [Nitrosomonas sp. Nm132]SDG92918.1 hypothetical protein SAMN05428952_1002122 [Nitrosomonas sp. Nm132]
MAISDTQKQYIVGLTVGLFNGAPGANFLREFSNLIERGTSFEELADFLVATPQFRQDILKGAVTSQEIAAALLKNFGLTAGNTDPASADAQAEKFVVDSLNAGRDIGDIIIEAGLYLLGTPAPEFADTANLFKNKMLVAEIYSRENADDNVGDLQAVLAGVTADGPTTEADAVAYLAGLGIIVDGHTGETFTLTPGADTIPGTTGNDTINALTVDANGAPATTFSAFDNIDGGAGTDILNIFTNGVLNGGTFPTNTTVKNVETINYNNEIAVIAANIDAANFVGATAINQVGFATDVINLAATTTAGFRNITVDPLSVQAAAAAATATVALTNVADTVTLAVSAAAGGVLNSVTVSGTRVDATPADPISDLGLTVTAGKDVESVSINTSINSTLVVGNEAGSSKALSTVDASASTGDITYVAVPTVANVKTGEGNDTATIAFTGTATANAASLSTGAGNDTLAVLVSKGSAAVVAAVVDAGEGDDTIDLTINAGVGYNVQGGAGNDTVAITGTVKTTDKIDGGEGVDTVSLAPLAAALVADDYIVFNKVLTNFETLKLTGLVNNLDAAQLGANYTTIDLFSGSTVDNVGTQALVANGVLLAEAAGYAAGATPTYAGTLNIAEKASGIVQAHAETVNLTIQGGEGDNPAAVAAWLAGEAKAATITLAPGTDTQDTVATSDDAYVASTVTIATSNAAEGLKDLASLTLSGNGAAVVTNADGTKLATVDASALNSADIAGKATVGLTYTSINTAAETIKLGAGLDVVNLSASTYGATDTVQGLNLVLNAGKTALDAAVSDDINLNAGAAFAKFTTTQTDLDLALKDAAASADNNLVFQLGGDTYIYQDNVAPASNLLDAGDTLVKLTGAVDLDALVIALAPVA